MYEQDGNGYKRVGGAGELEMTDVGFFKQRFITLTFYFIFISNLSANLDHGAIPACTKDI